MKKQQFMVIALGSSNSECIIEVYNDENVALNRGQDLSTLLGVHFDLIIVKNLNTDTRIKTYEL